MVDFEETNVERMITSSIRDLTDDYGEDYWREVHEAVRFPHEIWDELASNGWLGVSIPEEYGGQGLGMQEMAIVVEELAKGGAWSLGGAYLLTPIFGGETLTAHGTEAQKQEWLPRIADGDTRWALGVTEPDAGLNTPSISTTAEPDGDGWVIDGRKMWTSGAADADRITLLARSLPPDEADRRTHGFSVFLVDPAQAGVEYDRIPLDLFSPERTYNLYLDSVHVDDADLIGEPHEGLYQIFDTLNSERLIAAAAEVGKAQYVLETASEYANEREVFDVPIGSHQAIQHPLADAYADVLTSRLMTKKAAWLYDRGEDAGMASNVANLKASEAAWNAVEAAMTTFGGMSASKELGIAKIWQDTRHSRTAPVSEQMLRNYIGERGLGLPKSY